MASEAVRERSPDRRDRRDSSGPKRSGPSRFQSGAKGGGGGGSRRCPPERRIFVSNIPFEMKWQEVKDLFRENVGDVSYVELFSDENEKPRGCGILEFGSEADAKNAVEKMHRYDYKGRNLVVKEDFDAERDKFGRIVGKSGGRPRDGGGDRERGPRNDRDRRDVSSSYGGGGQGGDYGNTYGLSPQFLENLGIDGPLHTRLFVANLSYTVDERKLREVFRLAGRVVMVELNRDKEGKSRGHAVIEFDHPVEAVQAISMFNEQSLFDRKMTVRFDKSPGPTPEEMAQLPSRLPEGLGGVGMGLGSGGNPLTEVAKNLPGSTNQSNAGQGAPSGASANNGAGGLNVMEVVRTLQVAKQLDFLGGNNLAGALASLTGGGGNGGMSQGNMSQGNMGMGNQGMAPQGMGSQGMGSQGMGSQGMGSSGGMPPPNSMGTGPMGGGGPMGNTMSSSMGGMSGGQPMQDSYQDRPPMNDMGSRGAPSGYSSTTAPTGPPASSGYGARGGMPDGRGNMPDMHGGMSDGRGGMSDSPQMSSARPFDTIIIRNLPLDCNWQVLREGFSHCGDIKYAEMKERGSGLIRFGNERDAERAISMMHKQTVAGRVIDVRPY